MGSASPSDAPLTRTSGSAPALVLPSVTLCAAALVPTCVAANVMALLLSAAVGGVER